MCVQQCFDEVERVYDETSGREKKMTREDWAHGSLLITIELLRCSNVAAEVCLLMDCAAIKPSVHEKIK